MFLTMEYVKLLAGAHLFGRKIKPDWPKIDHSQNEIFEVDEWGAILRYEILDHFNGVYLTPLYFFSISLTF